MSTGSAIEAGGAFVRLFTDDSALTRGLEAAEKKLREFGKGMTELGGKLMAGGGAMLSPLGLGVKVFTDMGTELSHTSEQLGLSVEKLSALKAAAEESGASFESLQTALFKFESNLGSGAAGKHLAQLGIAGADLNGLNLDEQFLRVADALSKMDNVAERNAIAKGLFGRGVREMIPFLAHGRDGIEELMKAAQEGGRTMSGEDAEAALKFNRSLVTLEASAKMVLAQIGGALVPKLQEFMGPATHAAQQVGAWVKENGAAVVAFAALAAGIFATGAALVVFGMVATGAAAGIGAISVVLGAVLSPIGLGTVAVAGLVAGLGYLWSRTATGKEVVNSLAGEWRSSWGAIVAEVQNGRLKSAFEILFKTLELSWAKFWVSVQVEMNRAIAKMLPDVGKAGIGGVFNQMIGGFKDMGVIAESFAKFPNDRAARQKYIDQETGRIHAGVGAQNQELIRKNKENEEGRNPEVLRLQRELNEMRNAAMGKAIDRIAEKRPSEHRSGAAAMDIGEQAKGLFSSYGLTQSLAITDKGQDRIATATEKVAANTDGLRDKLGDLERAMKDSGPRVT